MRVVHGVAKTGEDMRLILLIPLVLLAACAASPDPAPGDVPGGAPGGMVGMANPAAVYCVKLGGTLETRLETGGEAGYCHLPDGRVIEEWLLFRQDHPQ